LETPFDGLKPSNGCERRSGAKNKKADVAEHPKVLGHVGLLFNEPSGRAGLFFS
jgi:hypothetical protein